MKSLNRMYFVAGILVLAGCRSADTGHQRHQARSDAGSYRRLLVLFPEDNQGLGADNFFPTIEHQPMTYGLVLSAETLRFKANGNDESRRRIRKAVRWLVNNDDLDNDGLPGWGLPQSWDAFQDGSDNPTNHPYTITTSIVMNGLLDALSIPHWCSEAEQAEIRQLLRKVVLRWCREVWSDGFGGGFFWYSPSKNDAIFTVNSPAMFLGSMMRLIAEHGDVFNEKERQLVKSRVDDLARAIANTVGLRDGKPYWDYLATPNILNVKRPNDLIHHVYTLWGIELYRDEGGSVELPWTRAQALSSIDSFWKDNLICEFPQDVIYEGAGASHYAKPAVLWSAGMMLAGYANWADEGRAGRTLRVIDRDYGPIPHLKLYPDAENDTFHPRQAAHVLFGLALYGFKN